MAFDVYRHVGGSERMRVATMWPIHLTFVLETSIWTMVSLAMDPDARRHPAECCAASGAYAAPRSRPRGRSGQLFQYHRRGFHPNDRDTTELIAQWRASLFGSDGQLTELLAS